MPDPGTDITPGAEPVITTAAEAPPPPDPSRQLWDGLQNLDTRAETLERTLIPGQDLPPGMTWQEARQALFSMHPAEQESETDPFEQFAPEPQFLGYDQQGQPVFADQQPQPFDPRSLAPIFEHQREQMERSILEKIQQQQAQHLQDQNLMVGIQSAAQEHNLSDFAKRVVETQAREMVRQQPNRAPADIAREVAQMYVNDRNATFVANGGAPAPAGQVPNGPIPADQRPKTFEELSRFMQTPGVMNQ